MNRNFRGVFFFTLIVFLQTLGFASDSSSTCPSTLRSIQNEPSPPRKEKKKQPVKICKPWPSRLQIGGNYTYVTIKPSGEGTSHGSLGGMQAMYEYRPSNRFYGGGKLSWKQGDTTGSDEKRSLLYIDVQERLGYTFGWKQSDYLLTLFSGFGYRYLRQHIRPDSQSVTTFNGSFFPPFLTSTSDIMLEYQELYIPAGFLTDFAINSWFSVGLYFTWMPQVFPTVDIKPLGSAFWALANRYANILVELPFTFTLTSNRRCALIVKPYYEYWQDGHSTAKTSTGIPLNLPGNTYNFGCVDINFAYSF
jgi:hypothetical protein